MNIFCFLTPEGYIVVTPHAGRWLVLFEYRFGILVEHVFIPHMRKKYQIAGDRVRIFYSSVGEFFANCLIENLSDWTGELDD